MILKREFYKQDTLTVAKDLLGKSLLHETEEGTTIGKIVETEAYKGPEDMASHAYNNLRTVRTEVMYGSKGHGYVYQIHGKYFCLNVTTGGLPGKPEAVLLRALEPVTGAETMMKRRGVEGFQIRNLTNGPGKLCMAMGITKKQNSADLCRLPLCIKTGVSVDKEKVVQTRRINVEYAEEWKDRPWRFYIRDNKFVSRPYQK
jgi:DNA-3-methyladenine glycosylase